MKPKDADPAAELSESGAATPFADEIFSAPGVDVPVPYHKNLNYGN